MIKAHINSTHLTIEVTGQADMQKVLDRIHDLMPPAKPEPTPPQCDCAYLCENAVVCEVCRPELYTATGLTVGTLTV